jgi:hypothetical protein
VKHQYAHLLSEAAGVKIKEVGEGVGMERVVCSPLACDLYIFAKCGFVSEKAINLLCHYL